MATKRSNIDRAILRAAENRHVEAVSILLDFASRNGIEALKVIDRDTVKATLENRDAALFEVLATAEPSVATYPDFHPLHHPIDWALKKSDVELLKVVIRHGGASSRKRSHAFRLQDAAKRNMTLVKLMIEAGYATKGSGALHSAAQAGHLDIICFLVEEQGADVNERLPADKVARYEQALYMSWTPLHWAASWDGEEAMRLLESYGADVDAVDVEGRTPAQLAQEWKDGKSYTKGLIRRPLRLNPAAS